MDSELEVILAVMTVSAIFSGSVAMDRRPGWRTFWAYFIVGFIIPIVGIIGAFMVKRPTLPPQPPGWYQDPWNPALARYYDGREWTWHERDPAGM